MISAPSARTQFRVCCVYMWEGKGDAVAAGGKELISASIFLAIHQRTSEWDHGAKNNHHNNGRHHAALAIYYRPDYGCREAHTPR